MNEHILHGDKMICAYEYFVSEHCLTVNKYIG